MDAGKTDEEIVQAQGENLPEKLPGEGLSGSIQKVSPEEARQRKKLLRRLIQTTLSDSEIEHTMHKAFGVNRRYVVELQREIFAEWAESIIRNMKNMEDDKAWAAYTNAEKILAMIEGNLEPTEINIPANDRLGEALLAVLGQQDPAKARALIDNGRVLYEKGNIQVLGRSEKPE
jgi:hypothetical protein